MSMSGISPNSSDLASLVPGVLTEIGARKASAPPSVSERLARSGDRPDKLSERELEVLSFLPTMLTASEIAAELYISVNTVKAHTRSIYRKLGASRRHEAVVRAYGCGILYSPVVRATSGPTGPPPH